MTLLCSHKSKQHQHFHSSPQSPEQSHEEQGCFFLETLAGSYCVASLEQATRHTPQHHFPDVVCRERWSQLWITEYLESHHHGWPIWAPVKRLVDIYSAQYYHSTISTRTCLMTNPPRLCPININGRWDSYNLVKRYKIRKTQNNL